MCVFLHKHSKPCRSERAVFFVASTVGDALIFAHFWLDTYDSCGMHLCRKELFIFIILPWNVATTVDILLLSLSDILYIYAFLLLFGIVAITIPTCCLELRFFLDWIARLAKVCFHRKSILLVSLSYVPANKWDIFFSYKLCFSNVTLLFKKTSRKIISHFS